MNISICIPLHTDKIEYFQSSGGVGHMDKGSDMDYFIVLVL